MAIKAIALSIIWFIIITQIIDDIYEIVTDDYENEARHAGAIVGKTIRNGGMVWATHTVINLIP